MSRLGIVASTRCHTPPTPEYGGEGDGVPSPLGTEKGSGESGSRSTPCERSPRYSASDGTGEIGEPRLYQLIRQEGRVTDRTFEIEFLDTGVEAFSFTFG